MGECERKIYIEKLEASPNPIWCPSRISLGTGPFLDLYKLSSRQYQVVRSPLCCCVLYRNIKTLTDCQILQDDLNSLGQHETDWQMKFNVAKCHSMRVTRHLPSNQIHFNYSLHQQTLEQVESAKYLGITITDNLEGGQHVSEISSQATKTLLWVFFGAIWHLHLSIRRKLHTKHWFALSSSMQLLFSIPIVKLRRKRWRKCRRQQLGGSAGDGIIPVASMTYLMTSTGDPWRAAG